MAKLNKYRADLSIDKNNIDEELLRQPQLFYEWAQALSEAEVNKDDAKDEYDLILIKIESKIRKNPKKYIEVEKITEGAIKSEVNNNILVKKARKKYQQCRKDFKLLLKAEKAFEQRKRMLEAYLYHIHRMMNSDVKVPRKYEKDYSERIRKDINSQLKGTIKRRG